MAAEHRTAEIHEKQEAVSARIDQNYQTTQQSLQHLFQETYTDENSGFPSTVCLIPLHFKRLWNHHNRLQIPTASRVSDAAPSGIKLPDLIRQHAREAALH